MRSMYFLPGLVLLFLPSIATAQSAEAVPATTIHARSNLVIVDVTVLDSQQNPVHNLTANDFKIFEDGHLQTAKDFEEHAAGTEPPPVTPTPKLEPGTFTNFKPVPASGPLNILLIDDLNTAFEDRPYVRDQVLKFLKQLRPGTPVAVFGLGERLYLLHGFTSDIEHLRAVVEGKNISPDTEQKPLNAQDRSIQTLEGLHQIARYLGSLPGRKNLIWFADSFSGNMVLNMLSRNTTVPTAQLAEEFQNSDALLAASRVAVYPIDAAGLETDQSTDAAHGIKVVDSNELKSRTANDIKAHAPSKPGDVSMNYSNAVVGAGGGFFAHLADLIDSMRDWAERTGGKPFFGSNDLAGAAQQAVEVGSSYYTLTYVPSKPPVGILPERSIKIEVARKDVTLYYRNKYPADNPHAQNQASHPPLPSAPSNAPAGAAPVLGNAMRVAMIHGAPEPAQIVFQVTARPTAADPEPGFAPGNSVGAKVKGPYRRYSVRYVAPASNLDCPAAADGVHHCALEFVAYLYDSDGELAGNLINGVKLAIPPDRYDAVLRDGIQFNQEISVPVEMPDCTLRVGILDMNSGRVGAVELPIAEAGEWPASR